MPNEYLLGKGIPMASETFDLLRVFRGIREQYESFTDRIGVGLPRVAAEREPPSAKIHRLIERLKGWTRPKGRHPRRIVIYRLGSLGDTIVALPCLHKIAESFSGSERYVLTNTPVSPKAPSLASLLANTGLIHGVVDYPVGMRSIQQILGLAWRLRRLGATTLVYLAVPRGRRPILVYRDVLFFRLCGFRHFVGVPLTQDLILHRRDPTTGLHEQECKRLARTLAELGAIDLDRREAWDLRLTESERAAGTNILAPFEGRPYIAINMGGKAAQNHWGSENWRRLLADLARTHGSLGILTIGVGEEAADAAAVTKDWPSPVVNACGRLSPRESAAALENASLFVGHDTGPLHLAAAQGVPCVGLFSQLNPPGMWYPYGRAHRVIYGKNGIAAISVGEAVRAVREALPIAETERALLS
jgi:heptosyltransferase-3